MSLPLPYQITDPPEAEAIQGNFDALKNEFPLSRKNMVIEAPHVVGASGEPAFQNSWVNYDTTTFMGARFWKDPMGIVHIDGMVKSGTIGATIFSLPAGYRPSNGLLFVTLANGAIARFDVAPTGNVVSQSGSNVWFSIQASFKGEQ